MGAFFGAVQGSYAYLLIFQIIVVTVLLLFLLWLIARRLREFGEPETVPAMPDEGAARMSTEQTDRIRTLESQLSEAQTAGSNVTEWKDKNKTLQDKVKFLEGKLLEYQILQEEIGTLSALKSENEGLKKLLSQAGTAIPAAPPPTPESTPAPAAVAPAARPAPAEKRIELESPADGLKPFDDVPETSKDAKAVAESLGQDEIDGILSKLDNMNKK